jgi:hypothetical protein
MGNSDRSPAQADNDPEQKKRDAAQKQRLIDYKLTFTSQHGERVLKHLKEQFGYGAPSYGGDGDPFSCVHRDGAKTVLAHIITAIEADPNGRAE